MTTNEDVQRAYHELIVKEAHLLSESRRPPYSVRNPEYALELGELVTLFKKYHNNGERIFESLKQLGYLVDVGSDEYRSLHMDVLVRSTMVRTRFDYDPYILSARFNIYQIPIPIQEDRMIKPLKDSHFDSLQRRLWSAILSFFGDEDIAKRFINIMREYLRDKNTGSWGLDLFQTITLIKLFNSDKHVHIITAPTGSGKTIIFSLYVLARLIRGKLEGRKERAIFIYPRRVLSIDQTGRFIRLLHISKKYGFEFTLGLRDGQTPRDTPRTDNFRGIQCQCGGQLKYRRYRDSFLLECDKCSNIYRFICVTRKEMGNNPPDILVTNMWALETRLIDSEAQDINARHFKNAKILVIDEAHEYHGLSAGLVSVLLRLVRHLANPTIILSSATIPAPLDFASKLLGTNIRNIEHHDFFIVIKDNLAYSIKGKRLIILSLLNMSPRYSWSTYTQLWSIMLSFIHYVYLQDKRAFRPQAIVFINNIKELRRTHRGIEENISLGEPRDHILGYKQKSTSPKEDGYMYYHYASEDIRFKLIDLFQTPGGKLEPLLYYIGELHSQTEEKERNQIVRRLKNGDLAVVLATSTLELGVDYDYVSFILNTGIDNPISLAQRIGRGGRSSNCLRTALGIILTKNVPQEAFFLYDPHIWERLNPAPSPKSLQEHIGAIPVTIGNPQIKKRGYLTAAMTYLALDEERTYASGIPIKDLDTLREFLEKLKNKLNNIGGIEFE